MSGFMKESGLQKKVMIGVAVAGVGFTALYGFSRWKAKSESSEKAPAKVDLHSSDTHSAREPANQPKQMATGPVLKDGYYECDLYNMGWIVPTRYTDLSLVGSGAFGQVCSANDSQTDTKVAIKKIARPFLDAKIAKCTYREICMLKHMNHDNVIGLLDIFTSAHTWEDCEDIYLVTDFMMADLETVARNENLCDDHIKFFVYQILRALKYLHSAGILHRDLKPRNIAVNENLELKLLDFGLARQEDEEMTGYVVTRWYRAPEVILNWTHYNTSVDMWSVGCIMAELLNEKTLFNANDYVAQLKQIMALTGTPCDELLTKLTSEDARTYLATFPKMEKQDFKTVFPKASDLAIDLLEQMLELDPDQRISAEKALAHPYLLNFADPDDEPVSDTCVIDSNLVCDSQDIRQWKQIIFKELHVPLKGSKDSNEPIGKC